MFKNPNIRKLLYAGISGFLLFFSACADQQQPDNLIPQEQMVNIMYNYWLSESLDVDSLQKRYLRNLEYHLAVLRQYKVSPEQFEMSLIYYARHPDRMDEIYKQLLYKTNEVLNEGNEMHKEQKLQADTLILWNKQQIVLESRMQNRFKTTLPVSSLQSGDTLYISYTPDWLGKQERREATLTVIERYDNDSSHCSNYSIDNYSDTYEQSLPISSSKRLKAIEIDLTQNSFWSEEPRFFILKNFRVFKLLKKSISK